MFINGKVEDASVNWEIYKRLLELEMSKGADAIEKNVIKPKYDTTNGTFRTLVETIALATVSFFAF